MRPTSPDSPGLPATELLPVPVVRWLERAYPDGVPDVETVLLEGPARFRRGRLPWVPIKVGMRHRLGRDHVSDIQVDVGPLTVLRVLDAFVEGRGITRVGGSATVGPEVDQGAFHAAWCEAMMFPAAWERLPGLAWEPVDEVTARLLLPFGGGVETVTVSFDPATSLPRSYEVPRHKGRGAKVEWRVDYLDWRRFEGVHAPARVLVQWADEEGPWFEMAVERVVTGVPMEEPLARARAAVLEATAAAGGGSSRTRARWIGPVVGFALSFAISLALSLVATQLARRFTRPGRAARPVPD
jgi:hypothetical protein